METLFLQGFQGFGTTMGNGGLHLRFLEQTAGHKAVHIVIVHDEHTSIGSDKAGLMTEVCIQVRLGIEIENTNRVKGMDFLRQLDGKGAAFTIGAVHLNGALHHVQQAMGDSQSQTGALNLAVALDVEALKDMEKARSIFLANADAGIGDGSPQAQGACTALAADVQCDGA